MLKTLEISLADAGLVDVACGAAGGEGGETVRLALSYNECSVILYMTEAQRLDLMEALIRHGGGGGSSVVIARRPRITLKEVIDG